MAKTDTEQSELVSAAESLESQLRRFEAASETFKKSPLSSQKNLERAAHTLNEIAAMDEQLTARVQALVSAVNSARTRQQAQAQAVQARAEDLRARTEIYQGLLQQMGALGQDAAALNGLIQEQASKGPQEAEGGQFKLVLSKMDEVVLASETLTRDAEEKDFTDISRQSDSLRQQLLSARNRLNLLQQKLSG